MHRSHFLYTIRCANNTISREIKLIYLETGDSVFSSLRGGGEMVEWTGCQDPAEAGQHFGGVR